MSNEHSEDHEDEGGGSAAAKWVVTIVSVGLLVGAVVMITRDPSKPKEEPRPATTPVRTAEQAAANTVVEQPVAAQPVIPGDTGSAQAAAIKALIKDGWEVTPSATSPGMLAISKRGNGPITEEQFGHLANITEVESLTAADMMVSDEDVKRLLASGTYKQDLTALDLGDGQITDLKNFEGLESIKVLRLHGNKGIKDLSPLASLKTMTVLLMGNTPEVKDITVLNQIPGLQWVDLEGSGVTDADVTQELRDKPGLAGIYPYFTKGQTN